MATGHIRFLKLEDRTFFPVTRAEAVLAGNTTLDKVLANHDGRITGLRVDVDNIVYLTDEEVEDAYEEGSSSQTDNNG